MSATPGVVVVPPSDSGSALGRKMHALLVGGRRYFGSAGASLTQLLDNPEHVNGFGRSVVQVGLDAERSTSQLIRGWMADKPDVVLCDSVHVRGYGGGDGEDGDTDHVLLCGRSVLLVDTKRWKSRRKYSFSDSGAVLRSGRSFAGGRLGMRGALGIWRKHMPGCRVDGVVCVNSERVFVVYDRAWKRQPFRLVTVERLAEQLDYWYGRADRGRIECDVVARVAAMCVKPYDAVRVLFGGLPREIGLV